MTQTAENRSPVSDGHYDLLFGTGGATALLAGAGLYSACQLAGLSKFRRIGGVSGGSIFACIASTGVPASQALRMTIETNFDEHVKFEHGIYKSIRRGWSNLGSLISRSGSEELDEHPDYREWPITGLLGTSELGLYIRNHAASVGVDCWPESFWTMATTKDGSPVVFNKDGVFLIRTNGQFVQLSGEPVPLDIAVRYSGTIVGVLAALEYKGMFLYDGGLSRDGLCPVGVQIRHFGADPCRILACRPTEDSLDPVNGRVHRLLRKAWQVDPDYNWGPETTGVIEFRPRIDHVFPLKFRLSRDEKWLAVLFAFDNAVSRLAFEGILHGEDLLKARALFKDLGYWRDCFPAPIGAPQPLSERVEAVFTSYGLY